MISIVPSIIAVALVSIPPLLIWLLFVPSFFVLLLFIASTQHKRRIE